MSDLLSRIEEVEPVAYSYELAHSRCNQSGDYCDWHKRLSFTKPSVPLGSIRNLVPLYALKSSEGEA